MAQEKIDEGRPTLRNGIMRTPRAVLAWGDRLFRAATRRWGAFDAGEYWETRHASTAGQLRATGHIQLNEEDNEADYRAKREQIVDVLQRHYEDSPERTLLDAGCGTGIFTESFVDMGFTVTGVDFSATAVESARRRTKASFLVADLSGMRLHKQYDVIASIDVLFHVVSDRNWRKALATLQLHLKPGGLMLIQEHLVAPTPGESSAQQEHVHFRTMDQYRGALAALGMRIAYEQQYELPSERSWKNLLIMKHGSE